MAQNSLLDFLQGASNSAASNVSAPIDGLNWLMRKAGLPVSERPFLGSDWMAQQGLTVQPQNKNAGLLGEAFGGVLPMVVAAKAPQIIKGLLTMGDNAMAPQTMSKQAGVIRVSMQPDSTWLNAKSENGMVGGHVRDGALKISHSELAEAARGKGEGVQLYQALIDDALSKGLKVFSDSTVELPAARVYESLAKRGYNVKRLGGGVLDDGAVYGSGAMHPAFEVSRP